MHREALSLKMLAATVGSCFLLLTAAPALAVPPPMSMTIDADDSSLNNGGSGPFGFVSGIGKNGALLGDMWGVRPFLGQYGITLGIEETSEYLGNVSGGTQKGFDYDGLTQVVLQLDTQRAFGLYGGTFNVSGLNIHGTNLSSNNLSSLQTASGIESDRATRLWEMWYQQKFLEQDRMDIKIGQQSLDQEFMVSQNAGYFINTMFGWPMVPSADLPSGGPAYPLSDLGVRIRARPTNSLTFLAGIYNGNPVNVKSTNPDSQKADYSGTNFLINGGYLAMAEMQFSYPALGSMVSADNTHPLSGIYKLGFWYDSDVFADQEYDINGGSLTAGGDPKLHRGNYSIYAVADQMLWHSEDIDDRTLNFFTRIMGTPQADRNLIDFSLNAGLTLHEPIFGRDDDTVGIGMGYAHVSPAVAGLDRQQNLAGTFTPTQNGETFVEAVYVFQATPWWQIQPDLQYVINPGGGISNATGNGRIGDELVLGVRTNILF